MDSTKRTDNSSTQGGPYHKMGVIWINGIQSVNELQMMKTLFHPFLKWLVLFSIALIVILSLSYQNGNSQYRNITEEFRASNFTGEGSESYISDVSPEVVEAVKPLFFVETAKCKIPYVDPFESDAMDIFHPEHFETCSNETALVAPIYDISRQRYVLFINKTLASIIMNSTEVEYNCYYQEITRDREHDSYDK